MQDLPRCCIGTPDFCPPYGLCEQYSDAVGKNQPYCGEDVHVNQVQFADCGSGGQQSAPRDPTFPIGTGCQDPNAVSPALRLPHVPR